MYDLIYSYIYQNLFNSTSLSGLTFDISNMTLNANEWLSHTATIICLCVLICVLVCFVKWIFNIFARLFTLR